jgi:hypothetical protein
LVAHEHPKEFSDKLYAKYQKAIIKYKKNPEFADNSVEFAAKEVLKKYEHSQIFKAKLLKTAGGFVALGLAIKPIDNFVETHIIDRYLKPRI